METQSNLAYWYQAILLVTITMEQVIIKVAQPVHNRIRFPIIELEATTGSFTILRLLADLQKAKEVFSILVVKYLYPICPSVPNRMGQLFCFE